MFYIYIYILYLYSYCIFHVQTAKNIEEYWNMTLDNAFVERIASDIYLLFV